LESQYSLSPSYAFRACLVEANNVSAAVTRQGLPVIRDQNAVPRNCQIGMYVLIKSDVCDTIAIYYCVTVNI
jgi:transketolase